VNPVASTAIRFHEYGEPPDVLRRERVEVASPAAGRVRVRVSAVGLNPADWELCRGFMAGSLPRGIGYDVAGTIDAVGDDVEDVGIGDLVFGTADFAGQPSAGAAGIAILDSWYRVPDGLDPVKAAVLPMAVQTATRTLDAMGLEPGTTLLVNGAGATVGFAAVQIALRRGARVIATAGPALAGELTTFGALVTPYGEGMADRVRDLAGGPVDLVFDAPPPNAGSIPELIAIAGDPGRVMTISNHDEARRLGARVNLDHIDIAGLAPAATFMPQYASLAADGAFRIPIARTYPLDEWRNAVKLSMSGHPHGKVVLLPEGGAWPTIPKMAE
jgi:NADPH:quinone reductase-like Zn-dependent oxidoreductase